MSSGEYDASNKEMKAEVKRRLKKNMAKGLSDLVREAIFADVLRGMKVGLVRNFDPGYVGHANNETQVIVTGATYSKSSGTVNLKYKT